MWTLTSAIIVAAAVELEPPATTSSAAPRVPVVIMVESYCPCSGAWPYEFYTKLLPAIGELVTLDRFFDASSSPLASQGCCNPLPNKTIPKTNVCFHGQNECVADRLQACAQALYPDKWLEYTLCINGPCAAKEGLDILGCKHQSIVGTPKNLAAEQECAAKLTMSWQDLKTCWTGAQGVELMEESAARSDTGAYKAVYGYEGLPVVWINGTRFSKFEQCDASKASYQQEFIATVCAASTRRPLPVACHRDGVSKPHKTDDTVPAPPKPNSCGPTKDWSCKPEDTSAVKKVHVLFSHHLDVGLDIGLKLTEDCVGFATKIIQRYFDEFIPRAIRLAQEMRTKSSKDRFAYTMHPWILSLYVDCDPYTIRDDCPLNKGTLRCPSTAQVAAFDDAVLRGDILWASSPMNLDPGVVGSPAMFKELLSISSDLDRRYNITKKTRVWSNVDVPGFVRSSVPLLSEAGVRFLAIGANGGALSLPDATMFRWKEPESQKQVVVMFHNGYGSNFALSGKSGDVQNSSLVSHSSGTALASYFRSDNTGPPTSVSEIESIFRVVRQQFPSASEVVAGTFESFAAELTSSDIAAMPLMELEWGDPWLAGLQTDPWRIQVYREMLRAREECINPPRSPADQSLWDIAGKCEPSSIALRNMTRWMSKISEHTQGVQSEGWSPGVPGCITADGSFQSPCTVVTNAHWSNELFEQIHNDKNNIFTGADLSWIESRKFNDLAIGALEAQASSDDGAARLAAEIKRRLPTLRPTRSTVNGLRRASEVDKVLRCGSMELAIDNSSGAIGHLKFGGADAQVWAMGTKNATLFDLRYQTYNDRTNLTCNESGCPNPVFGSWSPELVSVHHNCSASGCSSCQVVAESRFNETWSGKFGSPTTVHTEMTLRPNMREISIALKLFNKTTTRLPESTVLIFNPQLAAVRETYGWSMDVLGRWLSPYHVAGGGVKAMHSVWTGVKYTAEDGNSSVGLHIDSLDAAMACPLIFMRDDRGRPGARPPGAKASKTAARNLDGSGWTCENGWGGDYTDAPLERNATPGTRGVGGMSIQLHSNRMGISGFADWYPFGIKSTHKTLKEGYYQKADENILYRFVLREEQ